MGGAAERGRGSGRKSGGGVMAEGGANGRKSGGGGEMAERTGCRAW